MIIARPEKEMRMHDGIDRSHAAMIGKWLVWAAFAAASVPTSLGQTPSATVGQPTSTREKRPRGSIRRASTRPKLVVLLVVDQMRGDYVDKFLPQWTGGLRRLVKEGAW